MEIGSLQMYSSRDVVMLDKGEPKSNSVVLIRRDRLRDTDRPSEEGHVMTEAKIGLCCHKHSSAKDSKPELGRSNKRFFSSKEAQLCQHLDFGRLAS